MSKNILNFYTIANKLKNARRTGWYQVGISAERIESVADHIYGSLVLAMAVDSEYKLNLDMLKVFKMIIVKELYKIKLEEITSIEAAQDRRGLSLDILKEMTEGMVMQEELATLLDEANKKETKEARFAFQIAKIESDIQAKLYDLDGNFAIDKAIEDAKQYGEGLAEQIVPQIKSASDGWILYDRQFYEDEVFKELSEEIQNM